MNEKPASAIEYTAQAASPLINGEVKLTIGGSALTVAALFDVAEIPYAEINELKLVDYTVIVNSDGGLYTFSRLGNWSQPFYDALFDAYNRTVLRSLFITGDPMLTAKGDYWYTEKNASASGSAPIHVYENNVTVLPPDLSARRVPLCYVSGMDKGDFALTLKLDTGENYTYAKLGYDTKPFAEIIEKHIRALREKTLEAVKEIDPTLSVAQASRLASLVPSGAAASFGQLSGIAPSFTTALEKKISATRAAESYKVFQELSDPARIWIGFRKNEATGYSPGESVADSAEEAAPDPYLLWLIVPSPDGRSAAVEFAEANSATFVYRTGGDFEYFTRQLSRALEAINFRREVIRMSDDELRKPENADYYMACKRTAALQLVRSSFVSRIIHSGADNWKRKLIDLWNA